MTTEIAESPKNGTLTRSARMSQRGVSFSNVADLWNFAKMVANSGLAPKGMEKPEAITVAIQMGLEIGLSPMASLQNIAVINGRPSLWGDAMLAVCRNSGAFDEAAFEETINGEGQARKAVCVVRRLPNGKPCRSEFSMDDAKRAGLQGKAGPWTQYPDRMLKMRARGFALRDTFGDFLRGMYSAEEVRDGFEDRENVLEVDNYRTAPSKSAALIEQLKSRQQAESDTEEPTEKGNAQEATETPPESTHPADVQPETPGVEFTDEVMSVWQARINVAATLAAVNKLEDEAAEAVPMPVRQKILEACLNRKGDIKKFKETQAGKKGELV